jgi:hypothetical protein
MILTSFFVLQVEITWLVPEEWWPLCKYLFKAITVKHQGWKTAVSFYHFIYCGYAAD